MVDNWGGVAYIYIYVYMLAGSMLGPEASKPSQQAVTQDAERHVQHAVLGAPGLRYHDDSMIYGEACWFATFANQSQSYGDHFLGT